MKKIIIFGAGYYGKMAYKKLKDSFEILCFADNNTELIGSKICGVPIVAGNFIKDMLTSDVSVFVCTVKHHEIGAQLREMGIEDYYIMIDGFLYNTNTNESMQPIELNSYLYHKKNKGEKNILYVECNPGIKTYRTALAVKCEGYRIYLLYVQVPPADENKDFVKQFDEVFTFYTMQGIMDFINNSEFDLIDSSNTPDLLTNLLRLSNKPIVHDVHDMNSLRGNTQISDLYMEYMANVYSDGITYVSQEIASHARKQYGLKNKNIFVLPNYVFEQVEVSALHEKLSSKDNKIHLVYEGGISFGDDKTTHRYFEDIWRKFADSKIHVHYYSQDSCEYCRALEVKSEYFHYEGNMGTTDLIREMSKYDCGLAVFNVTEKNRKHLEYTSANKVYEYLNAGIPVIVGGLASYNEFVKKYDVGVVFDYSKDVKAQVLEACSKKVPPNFLRDNGFTVMSYSEKLVEFYEKVKSDYRKIHGK